VKCVLAVDALCDKPDVVISSDEYHGMSPDAITMEDHFLSDILESPTAFPDFLADNRSKVFQALFVYQLQPLNPLKSRFVLDAVPRPDGKARKEGMEIIDERRRM
jgi:hypothetical protein